MSAPGGSNTARTRWGGAGDLGAAVRAALDAAGLASDALTPEVLAPLDQFHPGGMPATLALARRAGVRAGAAILDLGGGVGGPARTLAGAFDCAVTVLDLTSAYCRVGAYLTARSGRADRVTFVAGDALALPFHAAAFDLVWTQASGMNIADKERLYAEIARVLRPGGRLALQEIATGRRVPLRFPVPWASEQARSFLRPSSALRELLAASGFRVLEWADTSAMTLAAMRVPAAVPAPPPLGVHLLLGADAGARLQNLVRNLAEGRFALVQGVVEPA